MKLRYSPGIVEDLQRAISYYESVSISAANKFRDEVAITFEFIRKNPFASGVVYRDVRVSRIGKFPYAINYRIGSDCVLLDGVIHTASDPDNLRRRI